MRSVTDDERRRHPRVPLALAISLCLPDGSMREGVVVDASLGGVFVQSAALPLGTRVVVVLGSGDDVVETAAKVVRVRWNSRIDRHAGPQGFALSLLPANEGAAKRIQNLIEKGSGASLS